MQGQSGLEIKAKSENLGIVSKFIENSMIKCGLGDYEQFKVQISVDEAIKNIIEHGNLEGNKISIKCQKNSEIKILIEYHGKSFNPTIFKKPDLKSTSLKRGPQEVKVYFVKKYMDKVKYEFKNGKNILTLIKRI